MISKLSLPALLIALLSLSSCANHESAEISDGKSIEENKSQLRERPAQHPYGGWYCPDNLTGFPPVDIQKFDQLKVVNGRLPTREETRNGMALMYIDSADRDDARPLDIHLPKLARYYSRYTDKSELVIVIQASIIGEDTVVGFRYPTGGNGSAWYDEVSFLSDEEALGIEPTEFVFLEEEIQASKEEVWKSFTGTDYAVKLGMIFGEVAFFNSEWEPGSNVRLNFETSTQQASGSVSNLFGNIYMQIDYTTEGDNLVEKLLILEQDDGVSSKIQLVMGPFNQQLEDEKETWTNWLRDLKKAAEERTGM